MEHKIQLFLKDEDRMLKRLMSYAGYLSSKDQHWIYPLSVFAWEISMGHAQITNVAEEQQTVPVEDIDMPSRIALISGAWRIVHTLDGIQRLVKFAKLHKFQQWGDLDPYLQLCRDLRNHHAHVDGKIRNLSNAKKAGPLLGMVKWTQWDGTSSRCTIRTISADPIPLRMDEGIRPIHPIKIPEYAFPAQRGIGNFCLLAGEHNLPISEMVNTLSGFIQDVDSHYGSKYEDALRSKGIWPIPKPAESDWLNGPVSFDVDARKRNS